MITTTKIKTSGRRRNPALRKLRPTCRLPHGSVMRSFTAGEAQRLRTRLVEVLECFYDPEFSQTGARVRFVPDIDAIDSIQVFAFGAARDDQSPAQALSRDQEVELFQRFNYCRFRMMRIMKAHAGKTLSGDAARELLRWDLATLDVRNRIAQANLGLVPSMVERSRLTGVDFAELISEGQLALLRSIDKFDCSRGFKFSTYACRAIITSISRSVALMARQRARFPTEYDPDLQKGDAVESRREEVEGSCMLELREIWTDNRADLTSTERRILAERFGINNAGRKRGAPKTLRQVAQVFGVTKERVRQIQNKALAKLRNTLDEQVFAFS